MPASSAFETKAIRMPKTMLNWNIPASRPRCFGGAISEMYMGATTVEMPMPNPPMTRAAMNMATLGAKSRAHCADKVKNADPEQRSFASEAVRRPSAEQGANDGAVKRRGHGNAMQSGTQPPERLNCFFGAGNDDGIKAEKKSGKRRRERPEEDATIHKWVRCASLSQDRRLWTSAMQLTTSAKTRRNLFR